MSGGKIWFLLKFSLAFAVMLLLFEMFCRCSGSGRPAQLVADDSIGVAWKSDSDLICLNEGFRLGRINEYGYIGPAYPPDKPDGTVRIALMGDSYVVGRHLFDRHHFRNILEEELNKGCFETIQVLNMGLLAANFERMYVYYELFAQGFSPDYVVFFLATHNLNRKKMEMGPRLVMAGDSLEIDCSFSSSKPYEVRKQLQFIRGSGIWSLVRKSRELHLRGESARILFGKFDGFLGLDGDSKKERDMEQVEDSRRKSLNRAILCQLAEMNKRGAARCVVVCRDGLPEEFVECVKDAGIVYIDPSGELEELVESGIDPHYWEGSRAIGHWNHYAHKAVGEYVAEKMMPLIEKDTELLHRANAGGGARVSAP
jgi:hypothetical protein